MTATVRTLLNVADEHKNNEWGFTGTRAGMKVAQARIVRAVLKLGSPAIVRHGAAFGADREFHAIWREELPRRFADVWPADQSHVKLYDGQNNVHVNPVMPPLDRNVEIVKRSVFLVAAPHTQQEEQKSGTWHTIRQARHNDKPILIVWPNGVMTFDYRKRLVRVVP